MHRPRVLAVNPYIYDFAAYNFWSSPLGLLYIASILRKNSLPVQFIDCMLVREDKRKPDGRGPFIKEKVPKPETLRSVPKQFRRYGTSPDEFVRILEMHEAPDLVLITSVMTYWYRGAVEISELVRRTYPQAKIVIGGIYPTLCYEEARANFKAADLVVPSNDIGVFYRFIEEELDYALPFKPMLDDLDTLPYPAYDLLDRIPFVPLLTSLGCVFHCTYCATSFMYREMTRRRPDCVLDEIIYWHERGVERFVIYDDSFLYSREDFAKPLLSKIAGLPYAIDIYNPNAVNAAFIDDEIAELFVRSGFREVRIGLESIDPSVQSATGGKVTGTIFEGAIRALKRAGYRREQLSIYILAGLPRQAWQDVKYAIDYLRSLDVTPYIAEYTPIPHTPMFDQFKDMARFPIAEDAVYQNNALFPYAWEGFTEDDLNWLKRYAKQM
ncbi:MAG: Fe-S oxidoreductase [Deltaproteobacteria bacterium]|nr:Fe-S oxidoreductase [Deltaproteobacteria bacterium]